LDQVEEETTTSRSRPIDPLRHTQALLWRPTAEALPLDLLARRAIGLVRIARLSAHEERLLLLAEEVGLDQGARTILFDHARIYVALACCSWTSDRELDLDSRCAALVAALALAFPVSENLRELMGLDEKLRNVARGSAGWGLPPHAHGLCSERFGSEAEATDALESALVRIEDPGVGGSAGER
jgi:hypothetical protein